MDSRKVDRERPSLVVNGTEISTTQFSLASPEAIAREYEEDIQTLDRQFQLLLPSGYVQAIKGLPKGDGKWDALAVWKHSDPNLGSLDQDHHQIYLFQSELEEDTEYRGDWRRVLRHELGHAFCDYASEFYKSLPLDGVRNSVVYEALAETIQVILSKKGNRQADY